MSNRERRKYSGPEKVKILRLHLLEHKPISEVCEEQGIHPTLFYKWQKEFFENGAAAFERQPRSSMGIDYQKEVTALKERLQRRAEVLSEVTEEMVRLKKELGEI
jgi:transposase